MRLRRVTARARRPWRLTGCKRPRLVIVALALALAAVAAIVVVKVIGRETSSAQGPAPQTLKKAAWGLTEHNGKSMFPIYRDLGMGIFETQARWDWIAPTRPDHPADWRDPAYKWPSYLTAAITEAESHGMAVLIQIIGAPKWANGGRSYTWPGQPSDFADFAGAISKRYSSVRHWMIWGEPNSRRAFGPVVDAPTTNSTQLNAKQARAPRLYAQLVDAAYGALKDANSENLVIGGNTYLSSGHPVIRPLQWIRYMQLPDGSRPRMDMWGHNPYTFRRPNLEAAQSPMGRIDFSDLGRLTEALDRTFPGPPLRLVLSEWGVPTERDKDLDFEVTPDVAVKWVRSAMRIVRESPRIYTLGWSVPVDTPRNPQGLVDSALKPKPTYFAFKQG